MGPEQILQIGDQTGPGIKGNKGILQTPECSGTRASPTDAI